MGAEWSLLTHFRVVPGLASGSVREHEAVRVGSGRPRENAVPRNWHATWLMLITVRSQTHVQNVFRSL